MPTSIPIPIALEAGVPRLRRRVIQLPADFQLGAFSAITADIAATLDHVTITRTDGGTTGTPTVELALRIEAGATGTADCSAGVEAGRVTITGDGTFATKTASQASITVGTDVLAAINTGTYAVCTSATASVSAMIQLDGLIGDFAMASCAIPPMQIAGVYRGTYTCANQCNGVPSDEGGDIELTIAQAGSSALYFDDPAVYFGSVCGTTFRHLGGTAGYWEYGELSFEGDTATKHSTWVGTFTQCGGTCTDQLTRVP